MLLKDHPAFLSLLSEGLIASRQAAVKDSDNDFVDFLMMCCCCCCPVLAVVGFCLSTLCTRVCDVLLRLRELKIR